MLLSIFAVCLETFAHIYVGVAVASPVAIPDAVTSVDLPDDVISVVAVAFVDPVCIEVFGVGIAVTVFGDSH